MSTVIAVTADDTPAVRWRYVSDGVAEVCISNPTRMNAMTVGMWAELREAFETLSAQPLSAIVLTGDPSGHAFCAGETYRSTRHFVLMRPRWRTFMRRRYGLGCEPS